MRWMMAVTLPKTTACMRAEDGDREHADPQFSLLFNLRSVIITELTTHEHNADGEDFFCVCVGTYISKTDTGKAAEGEVKRGDIGARHGRPTHGAVDVRCLQTLPQLL